MIHNDYLPKIEVDPADLPGARPTASCSRCEPAKVLPMAQRYFLF